MTPELDTSPSALRRFGLIFSALVALFPGWLLPRLLHKHYPLKLYVFCTLLAAVSLAAPKLVKYLYLPWMRVVAVLGWINIRVLMGVLFFFIVTPAGLFMRRGKDPMKRGFGPEKSYLENYDRSPPKERMTKTY